MDRTVHFLYCITLPIKVEIFLEQREVFSSNPKINFPHSDFHNIAIRTFHKPIIHPYDNNQLSKGKKIQKKKFQKKKNSKIFFFQF